MPLAPLLFHPANEVRLRCVPRLHSRTGCTCLQEFGFFKSLWAPEPEPSPLAESTVLDVCRADGWDIKCTIGPDIARELGGTGALAKLQSGADVRLDYSVAFILEAGYSPPQGTLQLLSPSRFLSTSTAEEEARLAPPGESPKIAKGFWTVDSTDDNDVPTAVRWRMEVCMPLL